MENLKSPRGYFLFSTWASFISSEVSFDSSEVSFHSSEEFFILHLDISKYPRGNQFPPTQPCIDTCPTLNYCCEPTSSRRAPLPIKSKTSPCRDARECQVGGRPLSNGNSIVALTGTDALRLDTPVRPYWVRPASPIVPCVPTR